MLVTVAVSNFGLLQPAGDQDGGATETRDQIKLRSDRCRGTPTFAQRQRKCGDQAAHGEEGYRANVRRGRLLEQEGHTPNAGREKEQDVGVET